MGYIENKLWNSNFILIILVNSIQSVGFTMLGPTLPKFALQLGSTLAVAGLVSGIFAITALVARPFGGAAADRLDKKKLLLVTNIIMAAAVLGYCISGNVALLLFFRVIHGAAFAVNSTASTALAAVFIPPSRMGEGIGYMSISYILGMAVGPGLGLEVLSNFNFSTLFMISVVFLAIATVMLLGIKNIGYENDTNIKKGKLELSELFAKEGVIFAFLTAIISILNGQLSTFIALIGEERGIQNISLFFTVSALTLLVSRPIAGKLSDKIKLSYMVYPGYLCAIVAGLMIAPTVSLPIILLAAFLDSAGSGGLMPALQAGCIKKLGPGRTGLAVSTFMIGADIGQGVGPIMGGAIAEAFGYSAMLYISVGLLPVGMLVYYIYSKNEKRLASITAQ